MNMKGTTAMQRIILKTLTLAVAAMTTSLAPQALAQDKQATKGYNHKIPEKIMTPDKVETRIGTLEFFDGMPTKDTVAKVYDQLDFMRGAEAFLNGIPATSVEAVRMGFKEIGIVEARRPRRIWCEES